MQTIKTPKEIRAEKKAERDNFRADTMRHKIKIEIEFNRLSNENKLKIKKRLLSSLGYDSDKPLFEQPLNVRTIYHLKKENLHMDKSVLSFYEKQKAD